MGTIEIPEVVLPACQFPQIDNGTRGVIFKVDAYVAKVLFGQKGDYFYLRNDQEARAHLENEARIAQALYVQHIGNVPEPIGIEKVVVNGRTYFPYVMEYIHGIPRGDQLDKVREVGHAEQLVKREYEKANTLNLFAGADVLNPRNYFYDREKDLVRLIDFERWDFEGTIEELETLGHAENCQL